MFRINKSIEKEIDFRVPRASWGEMRMTTNLHGVVSFWVMIALKIDYGDECVDDYINSGICQKPLNCIL